MSQTSYNEQGDAQVGLMADSAATVVDSFTAETAIPFGRFVVRGTKPAIQCKLPASAGDVTGLKALGIAVRTQAIEIPLNSTAAPQYPANMAVSVVNFGRVWVETETAATDTTKEVYVRHTAAGALNKLGGFAAASGTGLAKLDNAKWLGEDKTINGRQMAVVEYRR